MRLLLTMAVIASLPVAVLVLLMAGGWAAAGPTLLAVAATLAFALALALLWKRDLAALNDAMRRLETDEVAPTATAPALLVMGALGREVERLARRIASRAALLERMRRADEAILERLLDPLIVLAADRSVRRANSAARNAFGSDMPAVLRHPDLGQAIDRAFASGMPETAELTLPVPVAREVHAAVVPMDPPLADGGRAIVVLSDRTHERAVERMRADFVANVSHELRTPLASVIGFIDTLRGPAADDSVAQQRFLAIMSEQASRMNRLIDDLLSLSRIELIEHQLPSAQVNVASLVEPLVASFEPRLVERSITLEMHCDDVPAVTGDADQLQQVLQNLLDNAVKYGRDGGKVHLDIAAVSTSERWPARPGVVIRVADEGAGIPREHLPRLTERFYRVDTARSRAKGGTGLGLAIVKHIVNRHRGQLLIESEEGVGTTVSIWLPQSAQS
jgi:two-component system, OmpR family, phosphate regulon sensor histidine kinase PhoR